MRIMSYNLMRIPIVLALLLVCLLAGECGIDDCITCTKGKCIQCDDKFYVSAGSCIPCREEHCLNCNSQRCFDC